MKHILFGLFAILFISTQVSASLSLGQVIDAAQNVAKQTPSSAPIQFGEPLSIETKDGKYAVRFFMFQDTQNPETTFQQAVDATKKAGESFKEGKERPGAYFVSTLDPNNPSQTSGPVHFTLSIQPEGDTKVLPTLGELLKNSPKLAHYKSSPLSWPGSPNSLIQVGGKSYQIRYFFYDSKEQGNFSTVVKTHKLENLQAKNQDNGYGPLKVFVADADTRAKGIHYVLSLKEVQ